MFGKLKDKLKKSLSIFSKKAEEEAEVEETIVKKEAESQPEKEVKKEAPRTEKQQEKQEEKPKQKKPTEKKPAKEKPAEKPAKEEKKEKEEKKKAKAPQPEPKAEPVKETPKKQPEEKPQPEPQEETKVQEEPKPESKEEKSGFFGKLKERFSKKEEEQTPAPKPLPASEKPAKEEPVKEEKKEAPQEQPKAEKPKVETPQEKQPEKPQPAPQPKQPTETEEKKGFFGKIKQTLTTKTISEEKFEELFWDLELILLENNVSVAVIEKIKEDLKQELVDKPLPRDVLAKIEQTLKTTLDEILSFKKINLINNINEKKQKEKKPYVIAFFGINGAGKTTSIAKLTHYLQQNNLSVVLAACDTFRAAAIQQLEEHANNLKVKMIKHDYGSDAAAVAYDAIKYAEKNSTDVVLIDTAGRLHSNANLMAELEKIIRITNPDFKVFVGESITGNDCIEQAEKFNSLVEMDGAILTKADVDEKGGAPLSISYTINKPILFLGVGQEYKDLEEFDKDTILKRLGF